MAGRSLPVNRSRTSLDQDKETFTKNQALAINKAINDIEMPVKAKHIRSAIIGTFQTQSSDIFWSNILRLPIHGNPIVAWKFCHTFHKLLREGHSNVLRLFGGQWEAMGILAKPVFTNFNIECRIVLVVKLDFHKRNPRFPGNLMIKDEELELACENDVNSYFQLCVELMDYMDEILNLQLAVYGSLDMSRSNSMTNAGQCRLAPLIPCIQDSSQIYDYIVKLLFKLHSCLPPDTLEGHRIRFLNQFKGLRQFYLQSSTLQYFKSLIQVPCLDENPPNFLISTELSRHVTPVVILPSEPVPSSDGLLVEFGDSGASHENGTSSPDLLAERDRYIEHLLHQVEQLSTELHEARSECQRKIEDMKQSLEELAARLSEKEVEVELALQGKEDIERKLKEAASSAHHGSLVQLQLQESEKKAKECEEKFLKLKHVYQKLREEHIALLRQKAETDKKLLVANAALEQNNKIHSELQESLELVKGNAERLDNELKSVKVASDGKIRDLAAENHGLREARAVMEVSLNNSESKVLHSASRLVDLEQENCELSRRLEETKLVLEESVKTQAQIQDALEKCQADARSTNIKFHAFQAEQKVKLQDAFEEKEALVAARDRLQKVTLDLQSDVVEKTDLIAGLIQEKGAMALQLENSKMSLELVMQEQQDLRDALERQLSNSKAALEQHTITELKLQETIEQLNATLQKKDEEFSAYEAKQSSALLEVTDKKDLLVAANSKLEDRVCKLEEQLLKACAERDEIQREKLLLSHQFEAQSDQLNCALQACKQQSMELLQQLLIDCAVEAEQQLVKCIQDLSKSAATAMLAQDQSEIAARGALSSLELLNQSLLAHLMSPSDVSICGIIPLVFPFAQSVVSALLQGSQLAQNMPDIEKADQLLALCISTGRTTRTLPGILQKPFKTDDIVDVVNKVSSALRELEKSTETAIAEMKVNIDKGDVGEMLENELGAMENAIEEAAIRIAKLWDNSKRSETGVKLEVNEKVLDSCTALMKAIIELIKKAKMLQEEIVYRGKGTATAKEFYKRNHHWTEGLLSAAKAVGFGAKLLTDAADKVVQGQAKFEQLTVASQEIAASTAQLVFASRVKAELQSKNLQALAVASKAVSAATGGVVAAAKHCAQLVEDSTVLDFPNLTLHQAKRLEMESQVRVLEYESSLEKERLKLSALRRKHYQLSGDAEAS